MTSRGTIGALALGGLDARGDRPFLHYFTAAYSGNEIRADVDALALALSASGVGPGDRIAVQMQNIPQFVIVAIAAWSIRAVVVPLNPMYKEREVAVVLGDCEPSAIVAQDDLYEAVVRPALGPDSSVVVITTSVLDYLQGSRPPALETVTKHPTPVGAADFVALIEDHRNRYRDATPSEPDDVAALIYTSGTTGPPKGAVILQRNLAYTAGSFATWAGVTEADVVMGLAPFFHVTGLSVNLGVALASGSQLVLASRFEPVEALRLMSAHRATYSVASITAYIALMNAPTFAETDLHAFQRVFSGGAPIAASTAHAWRDKAGSTIRNAYGLSETASVSHAVPLDAELRVDPNSGALSIGIPIPGTTAEIVDEAGRPAAVGTSGEIVISGPGVMRGYWQRPVETEQALVSGRLHTGDIGFTDADGWFYIVDRMKDMIIVSGYKVWPREVEDVLYQHPSVREVAVVGIPDDYQGEAVKAFVSLRPGAEASAEELIDFCRERMAAYKRPRSIEFLVELPKTASGKILRREVRGGP